MSDDDTDDEEKMQLMILIFLKQVKNIFLIYSIGEWKI